MEAVGLKLLAGVTTTLAFFWDSLYGLIFGFLIGAIVQVAFPRGALEKTLGPGLRGVTIATLFGIVASACSYGAAAAAKSFYQKGADVRSVFAFMISSTNMNVAIVIMFWAMLGWRFAAAEFFGGIIIIGIVTAGSTLLLRPNERVATIEVTSSGRPVRVTECLQCGMEGWDEHAVAHDGTTYLFCGTRHENGFRTDPEGVLAAHAAESDPARGFAMLREQRTWRTVLATMLDDVEMLRNELIIGFVVAGFAAALIPPEWLSAALQTVGRVPFAGYPLLLLVGLALAVVTFVCSMGNVPIARFLATAGIPLGANTTFIYGDLLIPPLVGIYRKSFPPRVVWTFLGLFVLAAMIAGAIMDAVLGRGEMAMSMASGSMAFSDRFTLIANAVASCALIAAIAASRANATTASPPQKIGT